MMIVMRSKTRCLLRFVCVLFLVFPAFAGAVGPDSPVRFDDQKSKDPWTLAILSDESLMKQLKVEVWLYKRNEVLRKRNVSISKKMFKKTDRKHVSRAELSMKSDDLGKLQPGVYSQKIVIKANRSSKKDLKPYRIQRWSYLSVGKFGVRPLTMEQYSAITDPAIIDVDHLGREAIVNVGLSEKLEIPLDKTKGTAAIPLGRLSGLQQEQPLKHKQGKKLSEEENERYEN